MNALLNWVAPAVYLVIAALFARATLRRWVRQGTALGDPIDLTSATDRWGLTVCAALVGVFWPVVLAAFGVMKWLWRLAEQDLARIKRLEDDLAAWRSKRNQGTAAEQRMARDIVETLEELLKSGRTR